MGGALAEGGEVDLELSCVGLLGYALVGELLVPEGEVTTRSQELQEKVDVTPGNGCKL